MSGHVDSDIHEVYAEESARLRNSGCMAKPIPCTIDICAGLRRRRVVTSKLDVIEACGRLGLVLSDV